MSFDRSANEYFKFNISLNPFRTGQCLSTKQLDIKYNFATSLNPFRTGQCLSTAVQCGKVHGICSLNPFRTGQCLSTPITLTAQSIALVLIPFVQGSVFRPKEVPLCADTTRS